MRGLDIDTGRTLEHLYNGFLSLYFKYLATAFGTVWQGQLDYLVVRRELATWPSSLV